MIDLFALLQNWVVPLYLRFYYKNEYSQNMNVEHLKRVKKIKKKTRKYYNLNKSFQI